MVWADSDLPTAQKLHMYEPCYCPPFHLDAGPIALRNLLKKAAGSHDRVSKQISEQSWVGFESLPPILDSPDYCTA